jgi:L-threonylcarbamoyladenylate synthase
LNIKKMHTQYFTTDNLQSAANLLQSGELIAFPTETVFGLGANALDEEAVAKIFVAKGRPSDNPLIVHLHDRSQLSMVARDIPQVARRWIDHFWPGALTIVLPKTSAISSNVTAGLETVGVRIPSCELTLRLLRLADVPIAAPSANRSGRPSATTWQAVAEDLDGRIAGIVCGDPTTLGIESTVVDATSDPPRILRLGGVSLEQLRSVSPNIQGPIASDSADSHIVNSPGLKYKHYQPRAKVILCNTMNDAELRSGFAFIGLALPTTRPMGDDMFVRICDNVDEYAAHIFQFFREVDARGISLVYCQRVSENGIGAALMDRLSRAAAT